MAVGCWLLAVGRYPRCERIANMQAARHALRHELPTDRFPSRHKARHKLNLSKYVITCHF
ncbi:hypothetical protein XAC3607_600017 [Xanthomonas citri pv. citri]|nr:hypothetical protein XACLD7_2280004 [Xanthomonas citri pv. citri]CEH97102.1 hypothetical protein XAC3607_600017 [Xanthomonas citri pv. citri]